MLISLDFTFEFGKTYKGVNSMERMNIKKILTAAALALVAVAGAVILTGCSCAGDDLHIKCDCNERFAALEAEKNELETQVSELEAIIADLQNND